MPRVYRRLPRSAFRPLRIEATLECGIISDHALPIDGMLYFLIHRDKYGRQDITAPRATLLRYEENMDTSLPLARVEEHGPHWYYAASFAQWPAYVDGQDAWSKRLAFGRAAYLDTERKKTVDIAAGQYKAYRMPVYYRHALTVHWYVNGAPGEIHNLLRFATHLGKKTDQGWGSVKQWSVTPVDEDWSVRDKDGNAMRAIPAKEGILYGYRPSYWLPKNQTICQFPAANLLVSNCPVS